MKKWISSILVCSMLLQTASLSALAMEPKDTVSPTTEDALENSDVAPIVEPIVVDLFTEEMPQIMLEEIPEIEAYPDEAEFYIEQVDLPTLMSEEVMTMSTSGSYEYSQLSNGTVQITKYTGSASELDIPSTLDGKVVSSISSSAFKNCDTLTKVTIPNSVTSIGQYAFNDCDLLEKIIIPSSVVTISSSSVFNSPKLKTAGFIGSGSNIEFGHTTSLPDNLFRENQYLTTVTVPSGITSIGGSAFSKCTALTSVSLPTNALTIGASAFYSCTALPSINLPSGLTSIGNSAFSGCNALTTVSIPDGVTTIGYSAFSNCELLAKITIPSTATTFSNSSYTATFDSPKLTTAGPIGSGCAIEFGWTSSIPDYAFKSCTKLTSVTIPDSITVIGNSAFSGCKNLKTVTMPSTGKSIGNYAFYECSVLEALTIPTGVTSIGDSAFHSCNAITEIILPDGVTSIGSSAFQYCALLEKLVIPSSAISFSNSSYSATFNSPKLTTAGPKNSGCNIEFGWTSSIPDYAFKNCGSLTTVTIPDGITTIGTSAFYKCNRLETVNMPSTGKSIGNYAFYNCTVLKEISIPTGVTSIGDSAFESCNALTEVIIPEGVATIGSSAFESCALLEKLKIPSTAISFSSSSYSATFDSPKLTTAGPSGSGCNIEFSWTTGIPDYAFKNCAYLTSVTIPEGVKNIGQSAFYGCSKLNSISLPSTGGTIGANAFSNCTALTELTVPSETTSIGASAFYNCGLLTMVYVPSTVTTLGNFLFNSAPNVVIYSESNSDAVIYAIDNEISFVGLEPGVVLSSAIFNRASSSYQANTSSMGMNGTVSFVAKYDIPESVWSTLSNTELKFKFPSYMELDETTLTVNGDICTDYDYRESTGVLEVPVSSREVTVQFTAELTGEGDLLSYAMLNFKQNGQWSEELLGTLGESIDVLTLTVQDVTASKDVYFDGVAPAGETVYIYLDGKYYSTVTASKAGNYYTQVHLDSPEENQIYTIQAACDSSSGERLTVTDRFYYQESAPVLKGFTFFLNSESTTGYDFYALAQQGLRPNITYTGSDKMPRFEVEFENLESIDKVYVSSTRSNVKKVLEAFYDEELGLFVAEGYFDEDDKGYLPGVFRVEYTLKHEEISVGDDKYLDEVKDSLGSYLEGATVTNKTETTNKETGSVVIPTGDSSTSSVTLDYTMAQNIIVPNTTPEAYLSEATEGREITSYEVATKDGSTVTVAVDSFDLDKATFYVLEKTTDGIKAAEFVINTAMDASSNNTTVAALGDILGALGNVGYATGTLLKYYGIQTDHDDLVSQIMMSGTITDKEEALRKAEQLKKDREALMVTMMVVGIVGTGGFGASSLLLSGMFSLLSMSSKYFYDMRMAEILGENYKVNWKIDPSGYVYDLETLERIEGVTATVYCVLFDVETDNDAFWVNKPEVDEYGNKWNSAEYNQENPLTTDYEGRYAWDVPEGWWRVSYEHEDYETTWSDWLPVPPPQTEVNVGLLFTGERENSNTLSFQTNGGSTVSPQFIEIGKTATKPTDPTKSGYSFVGWYSNSSLTTTFDFATIITANTTIYAKWEETQDETPTDPSTGYTFSFQTNGGTSISSQTVGEGKTATKPTDPTKSGYSFVGWYSNSSLTTTFDFATVITANTTIYAKWEENQNETPEEPIITYTVTFDGNGGDVDVETMETGSGFKLSSLPTPILEGYTFDGWFTTKTGSTQVTTDYAFTRDRTIYAQWSKPTYTVKFDSKGGIDKAVYLTTDEDGYIDEFPTPTHETLFFDGWYFTQNGGYESVTEDTVFTENTFLYARWKDATSYFGTYKNMIIAQNTRGSNYGGTVSTDNNSPMEGETVILTVSPTHRYSLLSISAVNSNGNTVFLKKISDDQYSFVQPAYDLEITAIFEFQTN